MTKLRLRITRVATCLGLLVGLSMLFDLSACVSDDRKWFSPLRRTIRHSDGTEAIQPHLLALIPLGSSKADVYSFLTNNCKDLSRIFLSEEPTSYANDLASTKFEDGHHGATDAASSISVILWTEWWYIVRYDMTAKFYFDKTRRLNHILVWSAATGP